MKFLMIYKKKSRQKKIMPKFCDSALFFQIYFIKFVYTSGKVPLTSAISSQPKLNTSCNAFTAF